MSRKQQSKPRSAQAEWSGQRPGQQDDASGSLYNGCVACAPCTHCSADMALECIPSHIVTSLAQIPYLNKGLMPISVHDLHSQEQISAGMLDLLAMLQPCRADCSSFTRRWSGLLPWPPLQW